MEFTAFEVLGPIMIGPSSSHTAGACKIARTGAKICGTNFKKVDFYMHGSFAHTYKGHGTDKALVGGVLGYEADDARIRDSFNIAKDQGLECNFHTTNLGDYYHPNSVKIVFSYDDKEEYVIGSSIGGGAMKIVNINGMEVEFRCKYPTLLLQYHEQAGVVSRVSSILSDNNYNIESINTVKNHLTSIVTLTIEIDKSISEDIKEKLFNANCYLTAKYVEV